MLKLAVIGKDVSKSMSPQMHAYILKNLGVQCTYEKVSIAQDKFGEYAEELFSRFDGFNVTIPYKQRIFPFLDGAAGDAELFRAVNTVVCPSRTGYNTDGAGFSASLSDAGISVAGKRVLVLGAGGAGRSCIYALSEAGANVFSYAKRKESLEEAKKIYEKFIPLVAVGERNFDLVVNCTGVGMHDTVGHTPFVKDGAGKDALISLIENCDTAVDLIYEPRESEFLRLARERGKRVLNGEAMLFFQAYEADCIFTGKVSDRETAKKLWKSYGREL